MAVPISLDFTPLTNPLIWFPTMDAFNQWVADITVSVTAENIPAATTTEIGGVLKGELAAYVNPGAVNLTYVTIATEEGQVNALSQQAAVDLRDKLDALALSYAALLTELRATGVLAA